jgi:hypothetical protein
VQPPTKEQVRVESIRIISTFTTLGPNHVQGGFELKKPPMLIDDIGLVFLAESLRGYVRQYNPKATVKATELRKSGLTVKDVVSVLQTRTGAV